jgi:hypothetical protein
METIGLIFILGFVLFVTYKFIETYRNEDDNTPKIK